MMRSTPPRAPRPRVALVVGAPHPFVGTMSTPQLLKRSELPSTEETPGRRDYDASGAYELTEDWWAKTYGEDEESSTSEEDSDRSSQDQERLGDLGRGGGGAQHRDAPPLKKSEMKRLILRCLGKKQTGSMKASKLKALLFSTMAEETAENVARYYKVLESGSKKFKFDGKKIKLLK